MGTSQALKVVMYWLLSKIFDVFENAGSVQLLQGLRDEAIKIKQEAFDYYDNECNVEESSPVMKANLNRYVKAYNIKAVDYNLKTYWYKEPLPILPLWD